MRFLVAILGAVMFFVVVGALAVTPETRKADDAARAAAKVQETQEQKKRQAHDDAVARCMGPGASDLPPRDYSAMLDACERDNVDFDPQVADEVEKRIAEERARIIERQDRDPAAERQPGGDGAGPDRQGDGVVN